MGHDFFMLMMVEFDAGPSCNSCVARNSCRQIASKGGSTFTM